MNNEYKPIKVLNTIHYNHMSRYTRNRAVYNPNVNSIYLESTNQYSIAMDKEPIYHVVDILEEGRLDKIAALYYGDASFYWAIAMANNIIDPFIIKANTILKIPYIENLFDNDGPLSII